MQFELSADQLGEIRDSLTERIGLGLARDGEEIRALPAFIPSPPTGLQGRALVLDTGGTNMRAAVVELDGRGGFEIVSGPAQTVLPVRDEAHEVDAASFFALHAELAGQVHATANLPVGYCFSYPSETTPSGDARLIHWTKGIDIPGVEGTLVGRALRSALADFGLEPQRVRVLNDTVASLLGGAATFRGSGSSVISGGVSNARSLSFANSMTCPASEVARCGCAISNAA